MEEKKKISNTNGWGKGGVWKRSVQIGVHLSEWGLTNSNQVSGVMYSTRPYPPEVLQ